MHRILLVLLVGFSLCSCKSAKKTTNLSHLESISMFISEVEGDEEGEFSLALSTTLAELSPFDLVAQEAKYMFRAKIDTQNIENVDFEYDRGPQNTVGSSIIPSTSRIELKCSYELVDNETGQVVAQNAQLLSSLDFDFDYSLKLGDLRTPSYGNYIPEEEAQDAAMLIAFRNLAKKVVLDLNKKLVKTGMESSKQVS